MIKKNLKKMIISSLIILLPALVGLVLWEKLPEQMYIHWGFSRDADKLAPRAVTVFLPPALMLILHWVCVLITSMDPKNKNQTKKALGMIFWIVPAISIVVGAIVYCSAFGMTMNITRPMFMVFGLMFIIIGNYLPKCRLNSTIGIKVKWALENEENWNATHRFSGRLWVAGGFLHILAVFLPKKAIPVVLILSILILAVLPVLYSYFYHRKQVSLGTAVINSFPSNPYEKKLRLSSIFIIAAVIILVTVLSVTGSIEFAFGDDALTVNATYIDDLTLKYEDIESIEYRDEDNVGIRTMGFGSPRLLLGTFQNDEFGTYRRYSRTGTDSCVVLKANDTVYVIAGKDDEETKGIYEELLKRTDN